MSRNFALGEAVLGTSADTSGLESDLRGAEGQTSGWLDRLGGIFETATGFLISNVIMRGVDALGSGIANIASQMIQGNSEFEQYNTQFEVLLGSADAAKERLDKLAEFGRKTPFELPQVVEADKILQGFGLHSQEAAKKFGFSGDEILRIAGDVASGTGTNFNEMTLLLGKFSTGATGEAIRRMQELGILTREDLEKMGVEFGKSGELMSPLPEAMTAVLKIMDGKYGGLMDKQSETFDGMLSNLKDWASSTIRETGRPIFDKLKEKLGDLLTFLSSPEMQTALNKLAEVLSLMVDDLLKMLPPTEDLKWALTLLASFAGDFFDRISKGQDPLNAFTGALDSTFGDNQISDTIRSIADNLTQIYDTLSILLGPISTWISENVELSDVLAVLGAVLGGTVVVALWGVLAPLLPIVGIIALIIGAVTLFRTAIEGGFGPEVQGVLLTAGTLIMAVFNSIKAVVVEDVWPELQTAFNELTAALNDMGLNWDDVGNALKTSIGIVLEVIGGLLLFLIGIVVGLIEATARTITAVIEGWRKLKDDIGQILLGIIEFFAGWYVMIDGIIHGDFAKAFEGFKMIWKGAFDFVLGIGKFFWDSTVNFFNIIIAFVGGFVEGFIHFFQHLYDELVGHSIIPDMVNKINEWFNLINLDSVKNLINQAIGAFGNLQKELDKLKLPSWLTPGSPTPLEIGILGINKAMDSWKTSLPALASELQLNGQLAMAVQGQQQAGGTQVERHDHYNMTINTTAPSEPIEQDYQRMRARAGAA